MIRGILIFGMPALLAYGSVKEYFHTPNVDQRETLKQLHLKR